VQVRSAGGWRTMALLGGASRSCGIPEEAMEVVVTAVSGAGAQSRSARLSLEKPR
jgi:hypothetical protein